MPSAPSPPRYVSHDLRIPTPKTPTGYALPAQDEAHAIALAASVIVAVESNKEFEPVVDNFMFLKGNGGDNYSSGNYLGFCVPYDRLRVVQNALGMPELKYVRSLVTAKNIIHASRLFA